MYERVTKTILDIEKKSKQGFFNIKDCKSMEKKEDEESKEKEVAIEL